MLKLPLDDLGIALEPLSRKFPVHYTFYFEIDSPMLIQCHLPN
jgi:hypothetical protein